MTKDKDKPCPKCWEKAVTVGDAVNIAARDVVEAFKAIRVQGPYPDNEGALTRALKTLEKVLEDPPDKRGKRNPGFGPLTEAFKEDFRKGWKCGCEDLAKGEDNTEMAFTKEPPWFACGYASALNRWNGTVNRYTQLGSELGCEEPKGPKK